MANEEQLSILKQGVDVWNKWKKANQSVIADLRGVDLRQVELREIDFKAASLDFANLAKADLTDADLSSATFRGTNLSGAILRETRLIGTDISARLGGSDFAYAVMEATNFANTDLSDVRGLHNVTHRGPSTIAIDVISSSRGKIPEIFLRGCGLSKGDIEYAALFSPALNNEEINAILYRMYDLRATHALQISPLFVSYSHGDNEFVDKLSDCLDSLDIRYWRDIHEMKAGRMEKQIDRAIRHNPTVLLILSENSLNSDWVEHEVRTARNLEKELGHDTLCPVAVDNSWKSSHWPKRVIEQIMEYNILDFSEWQDHAKFDGMFRKLIDGLELFYKG